MFFIGLALLLAGIFSEAMYITTSNIAYAGSVSSNSYMVLGVLAILVGFIFTLPSVKMPKVRVP